MVNVSNIAVATFLSTAFRSVITDGGGSDGGQDGTSGGDAGGNQTDGASMNGDKTQSEQLQKLIEIQQQNNPNPGAIDAYASETLNLSAGATKQISITPTKGFDLKVRRAAFDRRDSHSYKISIDGEQHSVNHNYETATPRKITQGGKIVAVVTNNSGSASELDFEFEGWAVEV